MIEETLHAANWYVIVIVIYLRNNKKIIICLHYFINSDSFSGLKESCHTAYPLKHQDGNTF